MSIIYEALNKTQKKRETIQSLNVPLPYTKKQWINLKLLFLPSILFLCIVMAYMSFKTYGREVPADNSLRLNGVFLSGNDKFAMINNEPYKLGDKVNNMAVVSIDMKKVRLLGQDKNFYTLAVEM